MATSTSVGVLHPVAGSVTLARNLHDFKGARTYCQESLKERWTYVMDFEDDGRRIVTWFFENGLEAVHFKLKFG